MICKAAASIPKAIYSLFNCIVFMFYKLTLLEVKRVCKLNNLKINVQEKIKIECTFSYIIKVSPE